MADTPEAPAEAPKAPESEAPQTTNPEPAPAPDMHGFTSDQLADMKKFFDANGGFDKIKSKISNPTPAPEPEKKAEPTSQPQAQPVEAPKPPQGRTNDDLMAEYYFDKLSQRTEYAAISKEIANGTVLKEMDNLGIPYRFSDGSWDNKRINEYLDLRAKTVPAKATSTEPDASTAPTVEYVQVSDGKITNVEQAYAVLQQDAQLKAMGQAGHPDIQAAEEFIKAQLSSNSQK